MAPGTTFEWDERKNSANRAKHGIGFAEASTAFGDPLSLTTPDPDHSIDEERFILIGKSSSKTLLVVVHTMREERIRLISARAATIHEKRYYEEISH